MFSEHSFSFTLLGSSPFGIVGPWPLLRLAGCRFSFWKTLVSFFEIISSIITWYQSVFLFIQDTRYCVRIWLQNGVWGGHNKSKCGLGASTRDQAGTLQRDWKCSFLRSRLWHWRFRVKVQSKIWFDRQTLRRSLVQWFGKDSRTGEILNYAHPGDRRDRWNSRDSVEQLHDIPFV